MRTNGHSRQTRQNPLGPDQREALTEFVAGMWTDSRRGMLSALLESLWGEYKDEPRYEELRQAIIDARRSRHR